MEYDRPPTSPSPSPGPELLPRHSGRVCHFLQLWRDYEATSYSPVVGVPQVNEQMFEEQVQSLSANTDPPLLSTPNMSTPSPNRSPPNMFHVFRVLNTPPNPVPISPQNDPLISPPPHPFKNDSIFEMVKTSVLGPSSKTTPGMDTFAHLISSGQVVGKELLGFNAMTELRRLDDFVAKLTIAGGPWRTGSVKVRMPCVEQRNIFYILQQVLYSLP